MRCSTVILAAFGLLCVGGAGAEEVWVDFGSHRSASPTGVQISRSDITVLELELEIPGVILEATAVEGWSFTRLAIPGAGSVGDIGAPQLPAFRRFVEIPEGATVSVDTNVLEWQSIDLAARDFPGLLFPAQLSIPKCDCKEARDWRFSFNEAAYSGIVKHELVSVEPPVTMRDHRMVKLAIAPIQYDVDAGTLRVASRVSLRLTFEGGDAEATMARKVRLSSRAFDAFVGRATLNIGFSDPTDNRAAGWAYPDDAPIEFLIVTPPAFVADLEPFIDWKTSCGYRVTVATTTVSGTTTTDIKAYITGLFNGATPPVYILMIGDSPGVLATYTTSNAVGGTDLPFVQMDTDLYPDMMISRWPIDDSIELVNMRDKILSYEQPTAANSAWLNRALFLAGDDYLGRVTTHEDVRSELMDPPPNSAETEQWWGDTEDPTTAELIADLNTGRAWAVYSAHSGTSGWMGDPPLYSGDMPNFGNIGMYPISHGHSCSSNEWVSVADVFGEAAVIQPSKGFVSYWGGSNSTYWDGDDWLERGFFDSLVEADMAVNVGVWDGHFSAVASCYAGLTEVSLNGGGSIGETYYWEIYNLNGDPTLDPFTRQPTALNVGAPSAIAPSATETFTVTVIDASAGAVPGALVGASQSGVLLGAGYTDDTGTAVFHIDAPEAGETLLVRVTAHNYLPTDENVMVGAEADGVVTLNASIYPCSAMAVIDVFDTNTGGPFSVALRTSVANSISVSMTDVGDVTGHFQGSAVLGADLVVADGDTLSAIYFDEDTGAGGTETKTVTAGVDCSAPVISGVTAAEVEPDSARVQFDTSEDAATTVRYGTACGALDQTVAGGFAVTHSLPLGGLSPTTTYFFAIDAVDYVGNASTNDNGGACFSFTTLEERVFFTEIFESLDNDLDGQSFTFVPNGSGSFYSGCTADISVLPVDPAGGTSLVLSDDDYELITLTGGAMVGMYGAQHGSFYVVSNGYISFGSSSTDFTESLGEHFGREQLALLYDDLNPSSGGTVSWQQLGDRVVVTWENVPEYGSSNSNTFQAEIHFDGTVVISYLQIDALDGLAGLSDGQGLDPDFEETDLSGMGPCGGLFLDGFETGDCSQWSYETP